jgi:two-component system sensor histidine kinase CpxA
VGLGLAITERAVRFHGGRVAASNRNGGGLMVEIRLPLTAGGAVDLSQREAVAAVEQA